MNGWIALIPFLLIFASFLFLKVKPALPLALILVLTALLAFIFWKTPLHTLGEATLAGLTLSVFPILWVISAAVFTYYAGVKSGAMDTIQRFLMDITPDRTVQAILITFCFGGFLESVAGFGTAVAIPAAMLVGIGFHPLRAAILSLVANSVPVAFGALGIPVQVLAQVSQLDLGLLTRWTALQLIPFSLVIPLTLALIANEGKKPSASSIRDALFIGLVFTLAQTLTAFLIGSELVAVIGSLVSLAAVVLVKKISQKIRFQDAPLEILKATLPYVLLLVFVLLTRLTPLRGVLGASPFVIAIPFPHGAMKIDWLTTPGTLLWIAALIGTKVQGLSFREQVKTLLNSLYQIRWSAATIVGIVVLSKMLSLSGMIQSLANLIAVGSGLAFPFFAPLIGAIGTFITGSDTSSNLLFGELQKQTAANLQFSQEWVTAANTSGATGGKMISPQSIAVASSALGMQSEESKIIRGTLPYCAVYVLLLGVLVGGVAWLSRLGILG